MRTYLFDASAAVDIYHPRKLKIGKILDFVLKQRTVHHKAVLYIPEFCIVEVFNALARMRFRQGKLSEEAYRDCLTQFRRDIHWASVLYPYPLNRYHMLCADEIIPIEHNTPRGNEFDNLSTFDILLIAMSCELAYLADGVDVFLLTCDQRIKRVFDSFKESDPEVRQHWVVRRGTDEPEITRWIPPRALYLPGLLPADLPPVPGQRPLAL